MGYRLGADANMGVATELKVTVDLETDMAAGTEKLKVTVGSMETGVDTDMGTDLKLAVDMSGDVGVAAGAQSVVPSAGADAGVGTGSMTVGTGTNVNVEAVVEVQAGTIAGLVPSVCVVEGELSALAKVQQGTVEVAEPNVVAEVEVCTGMGTVPSVCVVASGLSAPSKAQHRIVMVEMDTAEGLETDVAVVTVGVVAEVYVGISLEMVTHLEPGSKIGIFTHVFM